MNEETREMLKKVVRPDWFGTAKKARFAKALLNGLVAEKAITVEEKAKVEKALEASVNGVEF